MGRNEAQFVAYGHMHSYEIQPLDLVPMDKTLLEKTYFNTGRWRRIRVRGAYGAENQELSAWHVMSSIAFYLRSGRKGSKFEVWNGALDRGRGWSPLRDDSSNGWVSRGEEAFFLEEMLLGRV